MRASLFALLTAACVSAAPDAVRVDLASLAANAASYQGQLVRTCGWARNAFEDQSISVSRDLSGPGFTMWWRDDEPQTRPERPQWRCVTGQVEPVCEPSPDPEAICFTNASLYWDWKIVQAPRSGD